MRATCSPVTSLGAADPVGPHRKRPQKPPRQSNRLLAKSGNCLPRAGSALQKQCGSVGRNARKRQQESKDSFLNFSLRYCPATGIRPGAGRTGQLRGCYEKLIQKRVSLVRFTTPFCYGLGVFRSTHRIFRNAYKLPFFPQKEKCYLSDVVASAGFRRVSAPPLQSLCLPVAPSTRRASRSAPQMFHSAPEPPFLLPDR